MEVLLFGAYKLFVKENPSIKVSQRNFELQRPKHVRVEKDRKRLECACVHYVNIDHLWKALNSVMSVTNKPIVTGNADLVNKALHNFDKI